MESVWFSNLLILYWLNRQCTRSFLVRIVNEKLFSFFALNFLLSKIVKWNFPNEFFVSMTVLILLRLLNIPDYLFLFDQTNYCDLVLRSKYSRIWMWNVWFGCFERRACAWIRLKRWTPSAETISRDNEMNECGKQSERLETLINFTNKVKSFNGR